MDVQILAQVQEINLTSTIVMEEEHVFVYALTVTLSFSPLTSRR